MIFINLLPLSSQDRVLSEVSLPPTLQKPTAEIIGFQARGQPWNLLPPRIYSENKGMDESWSVGNG